MQGYETSIAVMASLSVFTIFLTLFWSQLFPDKVGIRAAKVANERGRVSGRIRAKEADEQFSLKNEPKKIFKDLVSRFNLTKIVDSDKASRQLRMAGHRGQGPLITFIASSIIVPIAAFLLAIFYASFVLQADSSLLVRLAMAAFIAGIGYYAPTLYLKNIIKKRQGAIRKAWPDALDLLLICVECGMGIETALERASMQIARQSSELAEELDITLAELVYLQDRRKAYENLTERTGLDSVRSLVTSLMQSEKYGTPLSQSLRVLAQESRDARMSEAERKAAALPPKLTVPMITFFLPVLFAVIITPAIVKVMAVM